jgi:hypothetical protein
MNFNGGQNLSSKSLLNTNYLIQLQRQRSRNPNIPIPSFLNVYKNYSTPGLTDYFKISDIPSYTDYVAVNSAYNMTGTNTGFMSIYNGPGTGGQLLNVVAYNSDIGLRAYNANNYTWNSSQAKYISNNTLTNWITVCCDYKGYEYQEYFDIGYYDIGWNGSSWEMSGVINQGGAKQSIQTYPGGTQYSIPTSFGYRGVPFTTRPNISGSNEYVNFGRLNRYVTKSRTGIISLTQNNAEKIRFNIFQSGLGIDNQTITFTNGFESSPYTPNPIGWDQNFYAYFTATDQPKTLRYSFTGILPFSYSSNGDLTNIGFSGFTGNSSNIIISDNDNGAITRNINSFVNQNLSSSNKYFTLTGLKENGTGVFVTGQYIQSSNTPLNPYQNYLTGDLRALYRHPRDFVSYDFSTQTFLLNIWSSGSGVWFGASNLYGGDNNVTAPTKIVTYPTNNLDYMYRSLYAPGAGSVFTPTIGTGYQRLPYQNMDLYNFNGFTKMYKPLTLAFSSGFSFNGPYNNLSIASWPGKETTNYGGNRNNVNQNLGIFAPYVFSNEDIRFDYETTDSANIKIYLDFSINKWVAKYTYNADTLALISVYHGPTNTGQNPFPCVFNYVSGQYPQVSGSFQAYISSGSWTGVFTKNDPQFIGASAFIDPLYPVDLNFRNYWNSRGY